MLLSAHDHFFQVPYELYAGTSFKLLLEFSGIRAKPQTTTIDVERPKPSIFVQTDKGIYKPGDSSKNMYLYGETNLVKGRLLLKINKIICTS